MLNDAVDFDSVAMEHVRRAFRGTPEKRALPAGTKLYKWTQHPLSGPRGVSAWWSPVERMRLESGARVPGLRSVQRWAANIRVGDREYARARSAVSLQWNTMSKPLVIRLVQGAYGWIGRASGQPVDRRDPDVILIGGQYQVWIPNLTLRHVRQIAALPYMRRIGV